MLRGSLEDMLQLMDLLARSNGPIDLSKDFAFFLSGASELFASKSQTTIIDKWMKEAIN
jgi:hypothetical protein